MTGQIKRIVIAGCVVVLLAASLLVVKFMPSAKKTSSGTAGASSSSSSDISVVKNDSGKISYVQLTNSKGTYTIRKSGSQYTVDTLAGAPLNATAVAGEVEAVATVSATQTVAQNPTDISQYGLDKPTATVVVGTTDNKKYTLKLGKADPMGNGSYLQKEGDTHVYLVDSSLGDSLTGAATSLVDMTLASVDSSKFSKLTNFSFGGQARTKSFDLTVDAASLTASTSTSSDSVPSYNIVKPAAYNANDTNVSTLCNALTSLSATAIVSLKPTDAQLSSYGLKTPQYTTSFTYNGKQTTLLFGKTYTDENNEQMVYVMIQGRNLVYGIATSSVTFYNWQLSDMASNLLWTVNIDTVKSINVAAGSQAWTFNLSGSSDSLKVTAGGKTLTTDTFRKYYQNIMSFYQQGLASKPANGALRLKITLNFNTAGKQPKVLEFYTIDDYKAFYSIDGHGDFYVKQSDIDNFIKISQDMADNKAVSAP